MSHELHVLAHATDAVEKVLMVAEARHELPDALAYCEDQGLSRQEALAEGKSELDVSPRSNWVQKRGGLPRYIVRIAKHLIAKGMSIAHAIATAINAAKRMCATGDLNWPGLQSVNPGSRAEACAAVAHWQGMKGGAG